MSNWSPKILWLIDYSLMTSITHWCNWLLIDDPLIDHSSAVILHTTERHFSCFLVPVFSFVNLLSVLDAFFLVSEVPVDDVETQSAITNADDSQLCNISLYATLYFITKQLNSNQLTSLKMELTRYADKNILHGYGGFFCGSLSAKLKLLLLREISVLGSYITRLTIEYLFTLRFFGLWANG